jgi:hypothetical protein
MGLAARQARWYVDQAMAGRRVPVPSVVFTVKVPSRADVSSTATRGTDSSMA